MVYGGLNMAGAVEGTRYRRILLKLSGEALMGDCAGGSTGGIDAGVMAAVADELRPVLAAGVQVAVVIGAGNIFRGVSEAAKDMNRATADAMGMLGTVINTLALQDAFSRAGLPAVAMSAVPMPSICEDYTRRRAIELLETGSVVIIGGGTSNPYFTTDTAAVLRGLEVEADIVMKATKVDGVYDKDPVAYPDAVRFERLTHREVVQRRLRVMDTTAATLAEDGALRILVFNMLTRGNICKAALGASIGTLVEPGTPA